MKLFIHVVNISTIQTSFFDSIYKGRFTPKCIYMYALTETESKHNTQVNALNVCLFNN